MRHRANVRRGSPYSELGAGLAQRGCWSRPSNIPCQMVNIVRRLVGLHRTARSVTLTMSTFHCHRLHFIACLVRNVLPSSPPSACCPPPTRRRQRMRKRLPPVLHLLGGISVLSLHGQLLSTGLFWQGSYTNVTRLPPRARCSRSYTARRRIVSVLSISFSSLRVEGSSATRAGARA